MTIKLKPLNQQVMVVLGASSGIGRALCLAAAERGASVLAAARGEQGLVSLVDEIAVKGGRADYAVCDASDFDQVRTVADHAVTQFGRIDSWVNVVGTSVYARFEETTPLEFRRIMEINFMGQVHGALAALPHLRRQGGALIAISSVESIVSLPLHSAYAASKHAVEGAFDALRRELMADRVPVSVTSIKPATINTPFFANSRSKLDVKPQGAPPFYEPEVVVDAVLHAAEHPVRELIVGGAGRLMVAQQLNAPRLMDRLMARTGISAQRSEEPAPNGREGNLYLPGGEPDTAHGEFESKAKSFSAYTWLQTHPAARMLATGAALGGAVMLAGRLSAAPSSASAKPSRIGPNKATTRTSRPELMI